MLAFASGIISSGSVFLTASAFTNASPPPLVREMSCHCYGRRWCGLCLLGSTSLRGAPLAIGILGCPVQGHLITLDHGAELLHSLLDALAERNTIWLAGQKSVSKSCDTPREASKLRWHLSLSEHPLHMLFARTFTHPFLLRPPFLQYEHEMPSPRASHTIIDLCIIFKQRRQAG